MDNITHSLAGLALARAGLNRLSPRAVLLLVLSANAPDIDILALTRGPLQYLEIHRGYTHSLLALPILAAICVLLTAFLFRTKMPWGSAYLLCCIGIASHLLLDWTNSYGVRLMLPFSPRWCHLDLNGLYDIWILGVLAFAAVWPLFGRLVSREIGEQPGSGRGTALAALLFFVLFDLGRLLLHGKAVEQLEARLYDDAPPLQAAALPDSFNPLRWHGVVETPASYLSLQVTVGSPLNVDAAAAFYKPPVTQDLLRVKATGPFRYFSYFARFPVWSQQPVALQSVMGRRFELTDLRFGSPGAGSFHCVALLNQRGAIVKDSFTFGTGEQLGWTE
jgi:inner membrane protein